MGLNQRIEKLIEDRGSTKAEVTRALGLSRSRLNQIINDDRPMASDLVESILEYFKLTPEEKYVIYTGEVINVINKTTVSQQPDTDPIHSMSMWMARVEREIEVLKEQIRLLKER